MSELNKNNMKENKDRQRTDVTRKYENERKFSTWILRRKRKADKKRESEKNMRELIKDQGEGKQR